MSLPDGMTIEAGCFYRRRDGRLVGPAAPSNHPVYPWLVGDESYLPDGSYIVAHDRLDKRDLVAVINAPLPAPTAEETIAQREGWGRSCVTVRQRVYLNDDGTITDPVHGGKVYSDLQPDRFAELAGLLPKGGTPLLPTDSRIRKDTPIYSGVLKYFPRALAEIARVSKVGNDKHNPGQPLHWSKDKSNDHADCIARHLLEAGTIDLDDGCRHSAKLAWRALANLETELEEATKNEGA